MDENLRMFFYMVRHDPALVVGLGLIAFAGVLWFHMLLRLESVGLGSYALYIFGGNWGIPAQYFRARKKYGWPNWPVYFLWPCLVVGVTCFLIGVFRL
jgi:hypothetical protein